MPSLFVLHRFAMLEFALSLSFISFLRFLCYASALAVCAAPPCAVKMFRHCVNACDASVHTIVFLA